MSIAIILCVGRGNQQGSGSAGAPSQFAGASRSQQQVVVKVECVQKQSIYGYAGDQLLPFLKLTLSIPRAMASCKRVLEQGFNFAGVLASPVYVYNAVLLRKYLPFKGFLSQS